ncbi:MAG: hypothetical protein KBG15_17740 [Kofleriaceae bacterium]|nr:hypothetical protein [Kofleriaceae bacterium]
MDRTASRPGLRVAAATWLCGAVVAVGCGNHKERSSSTGSSGAVAATSPGGDPRSGSGVASGIGVTGTAATAATTQAVTTLATVGQLQLVSTVGPPERYLLRDVAQSFEMPMPAKPELSLLPVASATGDVAAVQAFVEHEAVVITVVRVPLPAAQAASLDAAGLQLAYDGIRDQGAANFGGKVIENEDVKIAGLAARRVGVRVQNQTQVALNMQWLVYQPSQAALYMIGATYREADAARAVLVAKTLVAELRIDP